MKRIVCWWRGHAWDNVHGYYDAPNSEATCLRCGKIAPKWSYDD